jgi:hypothetical protein
MGLLDVSSASMKSRVFGRGGGITPKPRMSAPPLNVPFAPLRTTAVIAGSLCATVSAASNGAIEVAPSALTGG